MTERQPDFTPITQEQAADALAFAWASRFGQRPPKNVLALLLAQSALETGRWQQMRQFNFGNVTATANAIGSGRDFFNLDGVAYLAHDTAAEGADAYVGQLLSSTRPAWRDGLLTGDPARFNEGLQTPRYYSADPQVYGDALARLWSEFSGEVAILPDSPKSPKPTSNAGAIIGMVGAGLFAFILSRR